MRLEICTSNKQFLELATECLRTAVSFRKDIAHVGLSGGKTPKDFYTHLSKTVVLKNIGIYQVDERYVSAGSQYSNQKMIRDSLLSNQSNQPHCFHAFNTELTIPEAIRTYEEQLQPILSKGPLDICILGLGKDGHIASLFPHSSSLKEKSKIVSATQTQKFSIRQRLTLTLDTILHAKHILLLVSGSRKRHTLERMLFGKQGVESFPAKALLKHPNITILYKV